MVLVIAHRGLAAATHGENTLEAFLAAARIGAAGVELDVRLTADGALAVHHDALLPNGAQLSNIAAAELPSTVTTLPAVLDAVPAHFVVDIEIKNSPAEPDFDPDDAAARAVAAILQDPRHHGRRNTTVVTSFNLTTIDVVRAEAPDLATGWLTLPGYDHAWALDTAVERGHRLLLPRHESIDAALAEAARAAAVQLWAWTVNEPDDIARMLHLGVDAVITDHPERVMAAAGRGSQARGAT